MGVPALRLQGRAQQAEQARLLNDDKLGMRLSRDAPVLSELVLKSTGVPAVFPADGRPLPGRPPVVQDMTVSLPRGATCLLIGPNGAGKTTLLKVRALTSDPAPCALLARSTLNPLAWGRAT